MLRQSLIYKLNTYSGRVNPMMFKSHESTPMEVLQKLSTAAHRCRSVKLSATEAAIAKIGVESVIRTQNWVVKVIETSKNNKRYKRFTYVCPQCGHKEIQPVQYCEDCGLRLERPKINKEKLQ